MNKKSLLALICCLFIGTPNLLAVRRGYRGGYRRGYRHGGYNRGYYGGSGYYGSGYRRSSWLPFWSGGIYVTSTANQRELNELRARVSELEAQLDAVDRPTRAQYRTEIRSLNDRIAELEAQQ